MHCFSKIGVGSITEKNPEFSVSSMKEVQVLEVCIHYAMFSIVITKLYTNMFSRRLSIVSIQPDDKDMNYDCVVVDI